MRAYSAERGPSLEWLYGVEFLDQLGRGGKPSNIPCGICWSNLVVVAFVFTKKKGLEDTTRGDENSSYSFSLNALKVGMALPLTLACFVPNAYMVTRALEYIL
jgi:hypothetical protein